MLASCCRVLRGRPRVHAARSSAVRRFAGGRRLRGRSRRASGGRVRAAGRRRAWRATPRRTDDGAPAPPRTASPASGSTAGRPSRVARSSQREPLMPMTREGWRPVVAVGRLTGIWQTSSVPKRPSRSVAVPPRRPRSAAIWGRTSLQRSPLRGAAKTRSSSAPSGPANITDWTLPDASSTWSWSSRALGRQRPAAAPRSTRPVGRRRRPRRRTGRRRWASPSASTSVGELRPVVDGSSAASGSAALRRNFTGVLPVGLGLVGLRRGGSRSLR